MERKDIPTSRLVELCPFRLDRIKCESASREVSVYKQEVKDNPVWRRRYRKETSKERLEIEDEAILDFLTHHRKRDGFFSRNSRYKAAQEGLNRLERMLDKQVIEEKRRGRGAVIRKVNFRENAKFLSYLEDYAQKNAHASVQDAIRWILREFLRYSGYPVGQTLLNYQREGSKVKT